MKHGVLEQTWLLFVLITNLAISLVGGGALSLHLKFLIFLILQAVHHLIELSTQYFITLVIYLILFSIGCLINVCSHI